MDSPFSILTAPDRCSYRPDRISQMRCEIVGDVSSQEYLTRIGSGWRRFGSILFRHECPACTMCQSVRVPVERFQLTKSQRRVWKRNAGEVTLTIGAPSVSPAKQALFSAFHRHGHETKGWPAGAGHDLSLFTINPLPTEEWCYYLGSRLLGVGFVDVLAEGLSAIYFFHDPSAAKRSLGTFNILSMIDAARRRGLPHVYLGYYVAGCRSLEYKARFRPHEVLTASGAWLESAQTGKRKD